MPDPLAPPLDVVLTTEALPPIYSWRTRDGIYVGASSTPEGRDEAIRQAGHRVLGEPQPAPAPKPEPAPAALPPITPEAIRAAGMVPVGATEARSPRGPIRVQRLASPLFPDLQKEIRVGPDGARRIAFKVAGQDVPADPAAIVAALEALGPRRQPPMEPRR